MLSALVLIESDYMNTQKYINFSKICQKLLNSCSYSVLIGVLLALIAMHSSPLHADSIESYTLNNAEPAKVADTLRQLYGDEVAVAAQGQQLIVRSKTEIPQQLSEIVSRLDEGPTQLQIILSHDPHNARAGQVRVYGAQKRPEPGLSVVAGETVTFQQAGKREQEFNSAGLAWASVQYARKNADSIEITPTLQGETVVLKLMVRDYDQLEFREYSSTVRGSLGDWIALRHQPLERGGNRTKVLSSRGDPRNLYVRVIKE